MVLAAHNFWSHVPRCSTCIVLVIRTLDSCDTHICDMYVTLLIHHQVLWFDVPLDDVSTVKVLQTSKYAGHKEF